MTEFSLEELEAIRQRMDAMRNTDDLTNEQLAKALLIWRDLTIRDRYFRPKFDQFTRETHKAYMKKHGSDILRAKCFPPDFDFTLIEQVEN